MLTTFHVFGSIAEFERERIAERTREGLAAARKRGRIGGRPRSLSTEARDQIRQMRNEEQRSVTELARMFNVSRATIYRC